MASSQLMSNSVSSTRKKGHLEAGKRRLEEFRKKKAEGRAKKPAATGQQQSTDISQYVIQTVESELNRPLDVNGAVTSEADESCSAVTTSDNKTITSSTNEFGFSSGTHSSPILSDVSLNAFYANSGQRSVKDLTSKQYEGSDLYGNYDREEKGKSLNPNAYSRTQENQSHILDKAVPLNLVHRTGYSNGPLHHSLLESQLKEDGVHLNEAPGTSHASVASFLSEKRSDAVQRDAGIASTSASRISSAFFNEGYVPSATSVAASFPRAEQSNGFMVYDAGQTKFSSNAERITEKAPWKSSESLSSDSSSHIPPNSGIPRSGTGKSRSSFLDFLNVSRVPSSSPLPFTQSENTDPFMSRSSKIHSAEMLDSSASGQLVTNNVTPGSFDNFRGSNLPDDEGNNLYLLCTEDEMRSQGVKDSIVEWTSEVPTAKKDENFGALEQYIEDLTQEKFSLKRDLDASRALAESLAAENSSLTDSYNQQRVVVNQLKCDMESLQEEIKTHLLELDSVKMEYANAQLECNAADERAKILASEVIGLEEKALRLRSSELKLERELENSNVEIASYKKKVSSLQKERQNLQVMIDALQEEKKHMQTKLRKAADNVKSVGTVKAPSVVKNASTSTEDLGFEVSDLARNPSRDVDTIQTTYNHEMQNGSPPLSSTSSTAQLLENGELHFPVASAAIPPDQMRVIVNINSLISELAQEKEELTRALSSESYHSSKLKELNKELSRKLEVQTQRLELLTTQSMASESVLERPSDSRPANDSIVYTDEGDEVVERVLGWIMKLFPGGPSKRRTRKLI